MTFSEEELRDIRSDGYERLRAKGLLHFILASNPASQHKAASSTASSTVGAASPLSATTLGDVANTSMGAQTEQQHRNAGVNAPRSTAAAKDTAAPRTVPPAANTKNLSAEAQSWSAANYTTEQPVKTGGVAEAQSTKNGLATQEQPAKPSWGTAEQLALARAEHDSMTASGGKKKDFRDDRIPVKGPYLSPVVQDPSRQTGFQASPNPISAASKRPAPRPSADNYVPPHMREPGEKVPAAATVPTDTKTQQVMTMTPLESASVRTPGKTMNASVQSSKQQGPVAMTGMKVAGVNATTAVQDLKQLSTVTPTSVSSNAVADKLGAPMQDQKQLGTVFNIGVTPNVAVDKISAPGEGLKPSSTMISTGGKSDAVPALSLTSAGANSETLEAKLARVMSMLAAQQSVIAQQHLLLEQQHSSIENLQSQNIQMVRIVQEAQANIDALQKSLDAHNAFITDHCDRVIKLETMIEVYRALGTTNATTPFVVKVQYPDKTTESIQTFGCMKINQLLERILRKKQIALDCMNETATLTYLGEQLGHLSFVGENVIQEDSVLYLNYD